MAETVQTKADTAALRRKRNRYAAFAVFMAALLLVGTFLWGAASVQRGDVLGAQVVDEQIEKKEIAKEAQKAVCGTRDTEIFDKDLCERFAAAAQEPVVLPQEPPVAGGPSREDLVQAFRVYCSEGNCKGSDGDSPTVDDIAASIMRFCADGRCRGQAGVDGVDAEPRGPDYAMVLAAVTEYCSSGACAGRPGVDGRDGSDATQEMVLAAVQAVCADDACRGPIGADGRPGADGTAGVQGVSIVDVDCVGEGADSTWQIALSDGQILNGGGPCKTTTGGPPIEIDPLGGR
jgi:hypothetical protein